MVRYLGTYAISMMFRMYDVSIHNFIFYYNDVHPLFKKYLVTIMFKFYAKMFIGYEYYCIKSSLLLYNLNIITGHT